jgi:ATP-dependent Clp protease ATP-binding subunit ClpA
VATLHVRNVPDDLYEGLRVNAAFEGRSIGAQTVELLRRALETGPDPRETVRRRFPFRRGQARFTQAARSAVVAAQEEVRTLGHTEVGSEHVLLGLLREGGELARAVAKPPLGIRVDEVRKRVTELRPPGDPPRGQIAFSPHAKQALEAALRESLALHLGHIGPEQVLLGIAAVEESAGARILRDLGADRDALRAVLLFASVSPEAVLWETREEDEPEFTVVALTGTAAEWTATLNGLAADGWQLETIVGDAEPRAVFRRPGTEAD